MAVLVMRAFPHDDPSGTMLGQFTTTVDKQVLIEDNGVGSGSFRINRYSSEVSWCGRGNYVRAWRDVADGTPLAGFWVTERSEIVLSEDEQGGEDWTVSGPGPIHCLTEAIVWHRALAGTDAHVQRGRGRWLWTDTHPARPLVRMLEEAQARGCLPFVSWDFTRDLDSDGNPWNGEKAERISLEIGKDLFWVVDLLRETGLHVVMGPNFVVKAWDQYENDLSGSIVFAEGVNIRETSEREVKVRRAKGVVLVEGEVTLGEGDETRDVTRYRAVNDPATASDQGRRTEGFYQYTRTTSRDLLQRVGKRKLKKWRKWREGPFTLGVIETTGQVAMVDYVPGDTVAIDVPGSGLPAVDRISTITLHDIENGEYDPVLSFGDDSVDSDPGDNRLDGGTGDAETQTGTYPLDAFDRIAAIFAPVASGFGNAVDQTGDLSDLHVVLPAGWDVIGRMVLICFVWHLNPEAGDPGLSGVTTQIVAKMEAEGFEHTSPVSHTADLEGISASAWFWHIVDGSETWSATEMVLEDVYFQGDLSFGAAVETVDGVYLDGGQPVVDTASVLDTANPPSLAAGSYPADDVRYYAAVYAFYDGIPAGPSGYALLQEGFIDTYETGSSNLRVDAKLGTNTTEDPSAFTASGPLVAWTVRVRGASATGLLGSIPTQATTGSPWQGGNPWVITSSPGTQPAITIVAGDLVLTATVPARVLQAHVAPPPWLPHQREEWTVTVDVRLTGTFSVGDSGERFVGFSVDSDDRHAEFYVRFGDGVQAAGIRVVGATTGTYLTTTTPDWYRFKFGMVDGFAVAKIWLVGGTEPLGWQVSVLPEVSEAADWFSLWTEHGGESGDLVLSIRDLDATILSGSGDKVARRIIGYGDGTSVWFAIGEAYEPNTAKTWVDNQPVTPVAEEPDQGRVKFSRAPYGDPEAGQAGSAVVEAAYTKA